MIITTNTTIDLHLPTSPPVIPAVQGDRNTRCIQIDLTCDGVPWTIPADARISVRYGKPDGSKGYYDVLPDGTNAVTVSGSRITVLLAPQMLTVSGIVSAQLELFRDSETLNTFAFLVNVEADPSAGAVTSEDYVNWVRWMRDELQYHVQTGDFTGPQGPQGETGASPVRGVDYWTEEDQKAIVADVLTALPVWEGGSY